VGTAARLWIEVAMRGESQKQPFRKDQENQANSMMEKDLLVFHVWARSVGLGISHAAE
jgi:hypothetical protein